MRCNWVNCSSKVLWTRSRTITCISASLPTCCAKPIRQRQEAASLERCRLRSWNKAGCSEGGNWLSRAGKKCTKPSCTSGCFSQHSSCSTRSLSMWLACKLCDALHALPRCAEEIGGSTAFETLRKLKTKIAHVVVCGQLQRHKT